MPDRIYVLIDGENLDVTLGSSILHHAPKPAERPRWEGHHHRGGEGSLVDPFGPLKR